MAIADILRGIGGAVGTVGKAVAEEESGELPELQKEKRAQKQKAQDQQTANRREFLTNQLALDQKYGTLTPEQRTQLNQELQTSGQQAPEPTGIQGFLKAFHPHGATYQQPTKYSGDATPEGGTAKADESLHPHAPQQTEDQKLQDSLKKIDFYAQRLKASGVPDDQINMFRNEAIEKAMGAAGNLIPKNAKLDIQSGIMVGGMDEHGRVFTNAQIKSGEAGPTLKSMMDDYEKGEQKKADDADKKESAKEQHSEKVEAGKESRFERSLADRGTWTVAEGENGEPKLFNSKTGEMKEVPGGMHKSGFYAKQIAPIEAAGLNIKNYMENGVFDGPGDLSLQHEFFTATQPATGFRMTKVQQDILQGSQSWMNSVQAKVHHTLTGTWFSDEQRKQIAKAAQDAIAAKKQAIGAGSQSTGASPVGGLIKPKTGARPKGATMKVPGSDGKMHWSDGKVDLGVVQ
jgi:hypothetical protein